MNLEEFPKHYVKLNVRRLFPERIVPEKMRIAARVLDEYLDDRTFQYENIRRENGSKRFGLCDGDVAIAVLFNYRDSYLDPAGIKFEFFSQTNPVGAYASELVDLIDAEITRSQRIGQYLT